MEIKICKDCKNPFPLTSEFFPSVSSYYNGKKYKNFTPYCRKCRHIRDTKWKESLTSEHKEKIRLKLCECSVKYSKTIEGKETRKRFNSSEKGKLKSQKDAKIFRLRYPEKAKLFKERTERNQRENLEATYITRLLLTSLWNINIKSSYKFIKNSDYIIEAERNRLLLTRQIKTQKHENNQSGTEHCSNARIEQITL